MKEPVFFKASRHTMQSLLLSLLVTMFYSQTATSKIVWIASKKNYHIYLIPSIHAAIQPIDWSSSKFNSLAKTNGNVYFESSNNLPSDNSLRVFSNGNDLYKYINKETINFLKNFSLKNNLPDNYFLNLYPQVVFFELDSIRRSINGVKNEYGLDFYLRNLFAKNNFKIYGLESADDIYKSISKVPLSISSKALNKYVKATDAEIIRDEIYISKIIKNGDIKRLTKYSLNLQKNEFGTVFINFVFLERNKKLLASFHTYKPPSNSILILGAAHYFGEGNIISLLENEGFKINREFNSEVQRFIG